VNNFPPKRFLYAHKHTHTHIYIYSIILVTLLPLVRAEEKQCESEETVVWRRETGRQRTIALEHETGKKKCMYIYETINQPSIIISPLRTHAGTTPCRMRVWRTGFRGARTNPGPIEVCTKREKIIMHSYTCLPM